MNDAPQRPAPAVAAAGPWLWAAGVVLACTLAGLALERWLDLVDLIMIQLAGVVLVALRQPQPVSVGAVLASVLLFNLVLVPPRWGLNPLNPRHVVTLAVMLAIGLLISRLVSQAREQAQRHAQAEQQRTEAAAQAQTEKLRSTLLAGVSHDFRTPLAGIIGSATTLHEQGEQLAPAQRAALAGAIREQAQRLHHMVSDLLDLTRLEADSMRAQPEWCPADDLVAEALAPLRHAMQSHRVSVQVPPDAVVWCDARLLMQALGNLVDNALRHTPPGTAVRVQVALPPADDAPEGHWTLTVADDGPGLPPGSHADLFRKFHHGRGEPGAGAGTGLGLAICRAVARLHGGQIAVRPAAGACFVMSLPQAEDVLP